MDDHHDVRVKSDKIQDEMKKNGSVRVFRFLSDKEDYGVVNIEDYKNQIRMKRDQLNRLNPEKNYDLLGTLSLSRTF